MFPKEAFNVRADYIGNSTNNILYDWSGGTTTVLYESFNTGSTNLNANISIECGSVVLLRVANFQTVPSIERFKQAKCLDDITVDISGTTASPTTTVSMVLLPYDIAQASTTAVSISNASTSPIYVQDSGNISFALAILITIVFIAVVAMIFNSITSKKPWLR